MTTFCSKYVKEWKNEETCMSGMILALSGSNLVRGGWRLDCTSKTNDEIFDITEKCLYVS